ncbi:hypothetical protein IscW_ISCW006824 [Ixodes scapularis]|uniref:Uncharacterized protein n=1 Tax=Ixodes scapularis TaxID=6945 RepID=B7PL21_IXOSC|nr:hypothetical protein IscW_ISCW006824 [Ixodes scapularis]|eukprot:XP_002434469.1 hypothetical protein IscW_ISCW006824 [Ixodes scapularis]
MSPGRLLSNVPSTSPYLPPSGKRLRARLLSQKHRGDRLVTNTNTKTIRTFGRRPSPPAEVPDEGGFLL